MYSSRKRTARSLPYRGSLSRGSLSEGSLSRRISVQGGVSVRETLPPVDRQMPVKILPWVVLYELGTFTPFTLAIWSILAQTEKFMRLRGLKSSRNNLFLIN